jgi:CBS domain-containing protein
MDTAPKTLSPESTVRDAIDVFYVNHLDYLPVLDGDGHFVGELTLSDLFAACVPAYAHKMRNLKFLKHFEPLEDLLRNQDNLRVGDVMKKPSLLLEADSPVVEAILKAVQSGRRFFPVVKADTHLLGVVGYRDILEKVLRA